MTQTKNYQREKLIRLFGFTSWDVKNQIPMKGSKA